MSRQDRLAALFAAAGTAHHEAFARVDGDDPDWPRWYAEYLRDDLSSALGRDLSIEQIAATLQELADLHAERAADRPWHEYYAEVVLSREAGTPDADT